MHADELINDCDAAPDKEWAVAAAREILGTREPAVRRLPMLRWRFGGWKPLDDTQQLDTWPLLGVEGGVVRSLLIAESRERA